MDKFDRRELRIMLIAHDPHCWFCGKRITINNSSIDHFEPLSSGGNDSPANFRLACKPCNSAKSSHAIGQLVCSLNRGDPVSLERKGT